MTMKLNAEITTQAVVINDTGKILLLRRNKPGGWYTLPGGTIEKDEEIPLGLKRELFEETGLDLTVKSPIWIWQSNHIGRDLVGIVYTIYETVDSETEIQISPEHDKFGWFKLEDLFDGDEVDPYIKREELKKYLKLNSR